jgi:hypothetical protein
MTAIDTSRSIGGGRVYVAGAVIAPDSPDGGGVLPWRAEIFQLDGSEYLELDTGVSFGRYRYVGPTISACHGFCWPELAERCLQEVGGADVLFAWIDREDTIGTIAEIGAAHALQKPIFVAFSNRQRFYFVKQLATIAVLAPCALAAWGIFDRWYAVQALALPKTDEQRSNGIQESALLTNSTIIKN